ncbi:LytR/AlgR family response regulator transcription factor [Paraglaciecola arctica]|uniref:LytTr DNA-binding region n=1 Tax=Paraglaciecola arctica BSs20135 TaxID=493475 RepID=K6Y116_9ALTE|nr:LytTR family DNA-binding domain-containing protein [Paraglaciecola arctica]GAC17621.1 LytTr DNA-binding region [Paraglaciecola arctica BSs20135]
MRVVVIEDEPLAKQKLIGFITRYFTDATIVAQFDKTSDVLAFFASEQQLDLIFSDIELLDGQVFSALNSLDLPCPVIYTTSYDHHWAQAFQNQGIEYLLKPFSYKRFSQAMLSYEQLKINFSSSKKTILVDNGTPYKSRFLLRNAQAIEVLRTEDIVCLRATSGVISAYDKSGQHHMLTGNSISELEQQLDPKQFFRLNRSDLINLDYICAFENYGKDTLAVSTNVLDQPLITSKTRTAQFKKWLDR